jgi:hypothetical protein
MRKILAIAATTAVILAATTTAPVTAKADDGGAIAAGIIGGLTLGAILGAVGPHPVPPVAIGPVYEGPQCFWAPGRPYWDGYRWEPSRVRVCD